MKRFLLSDPANQRWVEAQEKRRKAQTTVKDISKLICHEMFPQLLHKTIEPVVGTGSISNAIVIEARQ